MRQCIKGASLFVAALTAGWMMASTALAHHLWVMEAEDAYVVCRGMINERIDPYAPACVTQISAMADDGENLPILRMDEKERVTFKTDEKPVITTVVSEWGDRVNTTRGKKLMNRQAAEASGLTVISAFISTQYSKTLFASSDLNLKPLGMKFEIVPLADPITIAPGKPVAFKLLFEGRPLAEVSVFTNHTQEFKTDANGVGLLSFEKKGMYLLYAKHKLPAANDPYLDYMQFMTFLTFEVK